MADTEPTHADEEGRMTLAERYPDMAPVIAAIEAWAATKHMAPGPNYLRFILAVSETGDVTVEGYRFWKKGFRP